MIPWLAQGRTHTQNRFTALFRDHPGEPEPEENFWTLWCKGKLTQADRDRGRHVLMGLQINNATFNILWQLQNF